MDPGLLDLEAVNDMLVLLSELHGRICNRIANCGDMEEATQLSALLVAIMQEYKAMEALARQPGELPG